MSRAAGGVTARGRGTALWGWREVSLEGALGESLESSSHRNDDDGAIFVHLPTNNYKIKLANEPSKMQSRDRAPADETYNGSDRKVQRRAQPPTVEKCNDKSDNNQNTRRTNDGQHNYAC